MFIQLKEKRKKKKNNQLANHKHHMFCHRIGEQILPVRQYIYFEYNQQIPFRENRE